MVMLRAVRQEITELSIKHFGVEEIRLEPGYDIAPYTELIIGDTNLSNDEFRTSLQETTKYRIKQKFSLIVVLHELEQLETGIENLLKDLKTGLLAGDKYISLSPIKVEWKLKTSPTDPQKAIVVFEAESHIYKNKAIYGLIPHISQKIQTRGT
ncbi:hypothetical protein SAMN02745150_00627 [Brevinema andersonii]|uniref:Uncharacterized protein n=1 Tax=Brevinema andersonii TaxID=34097 RepID=A0A1I1DKB9_BREAD|nr:hypothetical protein [Brevinema andersonii]SFB75419.1 hypothetical protein SAMN02745150_00627 [Brevinema andersonii]